MYLSTGELAHMFNLNKQTLFYYDKEGILKPEYRDTQTGYRKYRFEQTYRLALICYLRKTGLTIAQIRDYLQQRNTDTCISELKKQSQELRRTYEELLKTDAVIQRKILFAERSLQAMKPGEAVQTYYLKRAYLPLGTEQSIYAKEEFYFYPTIALYTYVPEQDMYETTFGAYLESSHGIDPSAADRLLYIGEQEFLCYCYKGSYSSIELKLKELRREYRHLGLSRDAYTFNIIDQFLEKDMDEYVTEIQIPVVGRGFKE